jgi:hypothetical protein
VSSRNLAQMGIEELVSLYASAASEHQQASENGDHKAANRHHDKVAAAYRELRNRGAAESLAPLLDSGDLGVRGWAGAHALEFSPADGERVLGALTAEDGLVGFTSQVTLRTWREGNLRFP